MNIMQNTPAQTLGKVLGAFLLTTVIVGTVLALFKVVGPLPLSVSQVTTNKMSTFDVTGESEVNYVPDEARVRAGIEVNAGTVATAQNQANDIINDITNAIKELDIDEKDIRTQNYSVNPQYDYNTPGRPRITGYQVSTSVRITVRDFEKLNQVIDTATNLGANQVGGIEFMMSEEKEEELLKQAREEAIEDAKASAKELAGLAGIRLGKVVNVYENQAYKQPPIYYNEALVARDAAGGTGNPTDIQPGSSNFNYSVTISYETL